MQELIKKPQFEGEIKAQIKSVGEIESNMKEVKGYVENLNNYYKNISFTEETMKEAKDEKSKVNKFKKQVSDYENKQKEIKEQEIKDYFEEYRKANNIDFITYEQTKINVTLSASMKSLKEQAKSFIDKITDDLKLIETQEHKAEILVEYKQTLNVSNAITTVSNRFKAIEEEKKKQEELKKQELENLSKPTEIKKEEKQNDEFVVVPVKKEITIKFNIYDKQLEQLIKFLKLSEIEYESEDL